jgi:hypothetical protein
MLFKIDTNVQDENMSEASRLSYKALGYIGPVIMGIGTFILMIACVMTLENRDKHSEVTHIMNTFYTFTHL